MTYKAAAGSGSYVPHTPSPFDKWQREQCGCCQVNQSIYGCDQRKFNYRDYKAGSLKLTQGCPMREDP
jgi:hypothetical protein